MGLVRWWRRGNPRRPQLCLWCSRELQPGQVDFHDDTCSVEYRLWQLAW